MQDVAKRREKRVRTALPVRVFGLDISGRPFADTALTLDISRGGARLGGLKYSLAVGDVIGVQRGTDKARFRVSWVGVANTRCEHQVGLCSVQPEKCIWPAELLAVQEKDSYTPCPNVANAPTLAITRPPAGKERRSYQRHACDLAAELQVEGSSVKLSARCTDISIGGCYLDTRAPLASDSKVRIQLNNDTVTFNSRGVVRTSHANAGMGIRFDDLDDSALAVLRLLMGTSNQQPIAPAPALHPSRFDFQKCAAPIVKYLQSLAKDFEGGALFPEAANTFRRALSEMCATISTLQQIVASPIGNDAELVSEQLLLHRIRHATNINLQLGTELLMARPVDALEARELLQATSALFNRLEAYVKQDSLSRSPSNRDISQLVSNSEPACRPN